MMDAKSAKLEKTPLKYELGPERRRSGIPEYLEGIVVLRREPDITNSWMMMMMMIRKKIRLETRFFETFGFSMREGVKILKMDR